MFFENCRLSFLLFFVLTFNGNFSVIAQNTLSISEINLIAKKTTVLVAPELTQADLQDLIENKPRDSSGGWGVGSGVIVGRQGNRYFVLTVAHNFNNKRLNDDQSYAIVTSDRKVHILEHINDNRGNPQCPSSYDDFVDLPPANSSTLFRFGCYDGKKVSGYDLAMVSFESTESYSLASIGDAKNLKQGDTVYISGWPKLEDEPKLGTDGSPLLDRQGKIICTGIAPRRQRRLAWSPLQGKLKFLEELNGYNLLYLDYTRPGMSGGPIFNSMGYLVGIHGQGSQNKPQCGQFYQTQNKKNISENDIFLELDELNSEDMDITNLEDESMSNIEINMENDWLNTEGELTMFEMDEEAEEENIDDVTEENYRNSEFSKGQNIGNVFMLLEDDKKYFSESQDSDYILSQVLNKKKSTIVENNGQVQEASSGRIEFGAFDDQTDQIEDIYQLFSFKLENMLRVKPSGGCGSLLLGESCH
jgi:hypothetical protein